MRYKSISYKIISGIKKDRAAGMKVKEICSKWYISTSTAYRILRGEYDDVEVDQKEETETAIRPVGHGEQLKCGLVKERHDMPTDLYVFNEALDEKLMFDYQAQLDICEHFIETYAYSNGKPIKDIVLYVTGIQCALASFIRACSNKRVNLILRHYNAANGKYRYQSIWSEFGYGYDNRLASLIGQAKSVHSVGCNIDEVDTTKFYAVSVIKRTFDAYGQQNSEIDLYICSQLSEAYQFNYTIIEKLINTDSSYLVFLNECRLNSKGTAYTTETVLRSSK